MKRSAIILLSLTWLLALEAAAEEVPSSPAPQQIELTIYPETPTEPAFPYRLLPEQTDGNAVGVYTKALMILGFSRREISEKIDNWLKTPLDEFPRDEAREILTKYREVLEYIDIAARRSQCHWDPPMDKILMMYAPEIQGARFPARLIALRTRLHIAEGNYEEALASLATGYSMAQQIAEQPLIVGGLVGTAIAEIMTIQLETLVTQPGAPSLYWAITAMPEPFIELKRSVYAEAAAFDQVLDEMLPELQPSQRDQLAASELSGLVPKIEPALYELYQLFEPYRQPKLSKEEAFDLLQKAAPQAKKDLLARGHKKDEVESLKPGEAVVWDLFEMYRARRKQLKWLHVSYWQAREALERPEAVAARSSKSGELTSLVDALFPPAEIYCYSQVVRQQRLAVVRCLEAIRLHAALNGGRLPAKLEAIEEVPVPINPATGTAFPYRLDGDVAILQTEGLKPEHQRQYRIRVAD